MTHYIVLFYLVLHYVCQIRYTALCDLNLAFRSDTYFDIQFRISLCWRNLMHDAQWTNFGR
jgi:hypothetical protein